jgi:TRAP-type C4-dicarboxylate transport system substrate-binding protein
MQKGVDGAEHSPTDVLGANFFEACKYYSLDEHTYELIPLIASKQTLDSMPADMQKIISECAAEALVYNRQVAKEQSDSALAKLTEKGMQINNDVNKQAFMDAVKPVNEKYADQLGRDTYNKIVEMGK